MTDRQTDRQTDREQDPHLFQTYIAVNNYYHYMYMSIIIYSHVGKKTARTQKHLVNVHCLLHD